MPPAVSGAKSKVIFVNRFFYPDLSATSQMLSDLAFGLAGQQVEIVVVTSRQFYEKPGTRLATTETIRGVRVERVWSSDFGRQSTLGRLMDYLTFHLFAPLKTFAVARRGDVVVAKTDPPLICVPLSLVTRLRGALLVNWLQDLFPEVLEVVMRRAESPRWLKVLRGLRNRALREARANVVLGRIMAHRVSSQGARSDRIHIIENWSDGDRVRPVDKTNNTLRREWLLQDKFVVGYSGNLGVAHEFQTIMGAAEALGTRKDIAFLFVGAGNQLASVQQAAKERNLSNVHFQPYQR